MITAEQAKELLAAATPGPWTLAQDDRGWTVRMPVQWSGTDGPESVPLSEIVAERNRADSALVAAAPDLAQTVIDLAAENAALRKRVAGLQSNMSAMEADRDRRIQRVAAQRDTLRAALGGEQP